MAAFTCVCCVRRQVSTGPGQVWTYGFVEARSHDGRKFRILTIIDEASRECLALVVARQLNHEDVLADPCLYRASKKGAAVRNCRPFIPTI